MKKLMIALAVVVAIASANAAAVSWASGTMKLPDASGTQTSSATTKINASLYIISESVYTSLLANLGTDQTGTALTMYTEAGKGTYGALKASGATAKGAKTLSDGLDYASGSKVYGLLLDTYAESAEKTWVIGNVGMAEVETVDQVISSMGLYVGNATTGTTMTWATAPVPEPTSGLLMLLGFAGLALKRKRA